MEGDLRRLREIVTKKRSSLYRSCLHERVILPDYRITSLLQFIHHFYNTFTSFIHHFYIIPSAHTSLSSSVPFVHHPLPERADSGFSAAPATLHGHAINCVPVHRFRMGRTPETGLPLAEWCEFPRYALARILMHAVKRACAFLAGFRVVCCLFYRFPVRNALRASQAVRATDVMVN